MNPLNSRIFIVILLATWMAFSAGTFMAIRVQGDVRQIQGNRFTAADGDELRKEVHSISSRVDKLEGAK